jgi:hypothetical protein
MKTIYVPGFAVIKLCYGFFGVVLCASQDVFANNGVMLPGYGSLPRTFQRG